MPEIGRPNEFQKFKRVKMAPKAAENSKVNKAEILNRLAGNKEMGTGIKYTDAKKHNKMGKDEFLRLLSHQLQNQDPMKPMDQHKFAADLAQFSQLEQMANMNASLNSMKGANPAKDKFYAASFLGKKVITSGATINLREPGQQSDVGFFLNQNASKAMVRLFDEKNQLIKQIDLEKLPSGLNRIPWDGTSNDGSKTAKGVYRVNVMAWNDKMEPIKVDSRSSGLVTGVHFENGETVLKIDGTKRVYLRDVHSFFMPNEDLKAEKMDMANKMKEQAKMNMEKFKQNASDAYQNLKEY
jgi:flagellar basal-body rod modification protein FlgD